MKGLRKSRVPSRRSSTAFRFAPAMTCGQATRRVSIWRAIRPSAAAASSRKCGAAAIQVANWLSRLLALTDGLRQELELVTGQRQMTRQGGRLRIQQRDTQDAGHLEHRAKRAAHVALFDAVDQTARNNGAFGDRGDRQAFFDAGVMKQMPEQFGGLARIAGVTTGCWLAHADLSVA